jgi:hypothetical protein
VFDLIVNCFDKILEDISEEKRNKTDLLARKGE